MPVRITSYNVCYTKLLRIDRDRAVCVPLVSGGTAVITSYSIHYTKLYELTLFTRSHDEWRREVDCILEDDWSRLYH